MIIGLNTSNLKIIFKVSFIFGSLLLAVVWLRLLQDNVNIYSGDTIYLEALYKDLIIDRNPAYGWLVSKSNYYFPDIFLYFIYRYYLGSFAVANLAFSVTVYFCYLLVFFYLLCLTGSKKILDNLAMAGVWGFVLLLLNSISPWTGPQNLLAPLNYGSAGPLFQPVFHAGGVVNGLLALAIFVTPATKKSKFVFRTTLLFFLATVTSMSDLWTIPWFVVGILTTIFFFLYKTPKLSMKIPLFKFSISYFFGLCTGWILNKIIENFKLVYFSSVPVGQSDLNFYDSGFNTLRMLFSHFIISPSFWIIYSILFYSILYFFYNFFSSSNSYKKLTAYLLVSSKNHYIVFFIFSVFVISFFLTFFICSYFSLVSFNHQIRYFSGIYLLSWILSGLIIKKVLSKNIVKFTSFFIFTTILFNFSNTNLQNYSTILRIKPNSTIPVSISCLDNISKKYSLTWGIGEYDFAKQITTLSKEGLRITQTTYNFDVYHWVSTFFYNLDLNNGSKIPAYNFIVSSPDRPRFNEIESIFGEASVIDSTCGWTTFIYLKGNTDQLNLVMGGKVKEFFDKLNDNRIKIG